MSFGSTSRIKEIASLVGSGRLGVGREAAYRAVNNMKTLGRALSELNDSFAHGAACEAKKAPIRFQGASYRRLRAAGYGRLRKNDENNCAQKLLGFDKPGD